MEIEQDRKKADELTQYAYSGLGALVRLSTSYFDKFMNYQIVFI